MSCRIGQQDINVGMVGWEMAFHHWLNGRVVLGEGIPSRIRPSDIWVVNRD
jgi:hypothetical protein